MEDTFETKSVAVQINEAMKAKGISLEKLAQLTGISERFLESIIHEQKNKLPSAPYMRGYFSRIASILNLDGDALWKEYQLAHEENKKPQKIKKAYNINANDWIKKATNTRTLIAIGVILGILLVVVWRGPAFIGKPTLALENFGDNISVSTSTFVVRGKIDPKNQITINDEVVVLDDGGTFEKNFTLTPGFNTFNFKVKGILGKELDITKQVYLSTSTKKGEKQVETTNTTTTNN